MRKDYLFHVVMVQRAAVTHLIRDSGIGDEVDWLSNDFDHVAVAEMITKWRVVTQPAFPACCRRGGGSGDTAAAGGFGGGTVFLRFLGCVLGCLLRGGRGLAVSSAGPLRRVLRTAGQDGDGQKDNRQNQSDGFRVHSDLTGNLCRLVKDTPARGNSRMGRPSMEDGRYSTKIS